MYIRNNDNDEKVSSNKLTKMPVGLERQDYMLE